MKKSLPLLVVLLAIDLIGAFRNDFNWRLFSSSGLTLGLGISYYFFTRNQRDKIDRFMLFIYFISFISDITITLKKKYPLVELSGVVISAIMLLTFCWIFYIEKKRKSVQWQSPVKVLNAFSPAILYLSVFFFFIYPTLPNFLRPLAIIHIFLLNIVMILAYLREVNSISNSSVFVGLFFLAVSEMVVSQNEFVFHTKYGQFTERLCYGIAQLSIWYGMLARKNELDETLDE